MDFYGYSGERKRAVIGYPVFRVKGGRDLRHKYLKDVVTLRLDNNKCTGCGICTNVCPHGIFQMVNGKAQIAYKDRCIECGACAKNCAFGAVIVNPGVG